MVGGGLFNNKLRITKHNTVIFPGCENDPNDPDGCEIWTNMSTEELKVCFGGEICNIPHSGFDRCKITKRLDQTISVGSSWINVNWDQEDEENNSINMHDTVVENEKTYIDKTGLYDILYKVEMEVGDKSTCNIRVQKNGIAEIPRSGVSGIGSKESSTIHLIGKVPIISLEAGDYVILQAVHDKDSGQKIIAENSYFFCERRY